MIDGKEVAGAASIQYERRLKVWADPSEEKIVVEESVARLFMLLVIGCPPCQSVGGVILVEMITLAANPMAVCGGRLGLGGRTYIWNSPFRRWQMLHPPTILKMVASLQCPVEGNLQVSLVC